MRAVQAPLLPPQSGPPWAQSLLHAAVLLVTAHGEEGSTRRRVYALVAEHPGLHQRDIARRLDLKPASAEHHLRHLLRSGLLNRQREGGFVRYFVAVQAPGEAATGAVAAHDKRQLSVLRQARPLEIVARLLQEDPVDGTRMGDLARAMRLSPGTLTYQVKKLEAAGLVQREQRGNERLVRLADRDDAVRLLLSYEPPADLVAGFEDLWDDVGL